MGEVHLRQSAVGCIKISTSMERKVKSLEGEEKNCAEIKNKRDHLDKERDIHVGGLLASKKITKEVLVDRTECFVASYKKEGQRVLLYKLVHLCHSSCVHFGNG